MQPVQSANKESRQMQSVPRPAELQSEYKKKDHGKSLCSDENCQETPNVHMQPVQPAKKRSCHIQSMPRPAMSQPSYKKRKSVHDDQCQSTVWFNKNCQETKSVQM